MSSLFHLAYFLKEWSKTFLKLKLFSVALRLFIKCDQNVEINSELTKFQLMVSLKKIDYLDKEKLLNVLCGVYMKGNT